jgi:hypothetical protein
MQINVTRRPRIWAVVIATVGTSFLVAWLLLGHPGASLALDPRAASCAEVVHGKIREHVALDRASDYRSLFPKMGVSPELEDTSPALFVVYEDPVELLVMGNYPSVDDGPVSEFEPMGAATYTGVICAITRYGRVVYSDVDTTK